MDIDYSSAIAGGVDREPLIGKLRAATVPLSALYLDPNNPRFLDLAGSVDAMLGRAVEEQIPNPLIQQKAKEALLLSRFEVQALKDKILELGFLPIDRIVVRALRDVADAYVVLEGNRRVAALKLIKEDLDAGRPLPADVISSIDPIEVVVMEGTTDASRTQLIIQGMRHIGGTKDWGPYQQARALRALFEENHSASETGKAFGLSSHMVNRMLRALSALQQMAEDEDYAEYATPDRYSMFEQALAKPSVRLWLGWDAATQRFENAANRTRFYSWITPQEISDGDGESRPKLAMAIQVRDLPEILADEAALAVLENEPGGFDSALSIARRQRSGGGDLLVWPDAVRTATAQLNRIPYNQLRGLDTEQLELLTSLQAKIAEIIDAAQSLAPPT